MAKLKEWTTNTLIVLGFVGSLLVFVPHPAAVVLGFASIYMLYRILSK